MKYSYKLGDKTKSMFSLHRGFGNDDHRGYLDGIDLLNKVTFDEQRDQVKGNAFDSMVSMSRELVSYRPISQAVFMESRRRDLEVTNAINMAHGCDRLDPFRQRELTGATLL